MMTILVVDDQPVGRRLITYTLDKHGYNSVAASGGAEALDILRNEPIALIIADLTMPEMDGIELLGHVRAMAEYADIPFIMLTASGQDEDRQRARQAGVTDFMTKPMSSRALLEIIEQFIGASTLQAS